MHLYEPLMFHKAYPLDSFLEESKIMEKEKERMFSYLPEEYRQMQKKVEDACDRMEYEGSRMYDEHPDGGMIRQMAKNIQKQLTCEDGTCENGRYQEDLVCCFLCNEMFRRRCRMWKSRQYIK